MTTIKVQELIRQDFTESLIEFSNGELSEKEANEIADKRLRLTDFSDNSPLAHKGPRWLAKNMIKYIDLTKKDNRKGIKTMEI